MYCVRTSDPLKRFLGTRLRPGPIHFPRQGSHETLLKARSSEVYNLVCPANVGLTLLPSSSSATKTRLHQAQASCLATRPTSSKAITRRLPPTAAPRRPPTLLRATIRTRASPAHIWFGCWLLADLANHATLVPNTNLLLKPATATHPLSPPATTQYAAPRHRLVFRGPILTHVTSPPRSSSFLPMATGLLRPNMPTDHVSASPPKHPDDRPTDRQSNRPLPPSQMSAHAQTQRFQTSSTARPRRPSRPRASATATPRASPSSTRSAPARGKRC